MSENSKILIFIFLYLSFLSLSIFLENVLKKKFAKTKKVTGQLISSEHSRNHYFQDGVMLESEYSGKYSLTINDKETIEKQIHFIDSPPATLTLYYRKNPKFASSSKENSFDIVREFFLYGIFPFIFSGLILILIF